MYVKDAVAKNPSLRNKKSQSLSDVKLSFLSLAPESHVKYTQPPTYTYTHISDQSSVFLLSKVLTFM